MSSNCARRLLQQSSSSAKAFLSSGPRISLPSVASGTTKLGGLPSPASRLSRRHNLFSKSRVRMELACGESLMPLHSVTASALLKSMLSSGVAVGCLSEEGRASSIA
nr:protein NUCLEAR FUSION DEFECTIVE 6, chloroplastic/mitochondrial isoform X2 [Coffea arabica]